MQATFIPAGHLQSSRRGIIMGLAIVTGFPLKLTLECFQPLKGKNSKPKIGT